MAYGDVRPRLDAGAARRRGLSKSPDWTRRTVRAIACAAGARRRRALLPARAAASGWAYRRPSMHFLAISFATSRYFLCYWREVTGQLCVQHKANESRDQEQVAAGPRTVAVPARAGPQRRRLQGEQGPHIAEALRLGCSRQADTCCAATAHCAVPAHENRRGNAPQRSLQRAVETSRARVSLP